MWGRSSAAVPKLWNFHLRDVSHSPSWLPFRCPAKAELLPWHWGSVLPDFVQCFLVLSKFLIDIRNVYISEKQQM